MKLNKIISILLVVEFAYSLYKIIPAFLMTFSSPQLIPYVITFSIIALLLASAIGIFFNKKWAIITLWIFVLLPFLARMVMPFILFIGGYYFVVINVAAATYLTITHWNKAKTNT